MGSGSSGWAAAQQLLRTFVFLPQVLEHSWRGFKIDRWWSGQVGLRLIRPGSNSTTTTYFCISTTCRRTFRGVKQDRWWSGWAQVHQAGHMCSSSTTTFVSISTTSRRTFSGLGWVSGLGVRDGCPGWVSGMGVRMGVRMGSGWVQDGQLNFYALLYFYNMS